MQVCLTCGTERESKVRFEGPRYRRTQDRVPDFLSTPMHFEAETRLEQVGDVSSLAA
jgi:hypothetical protein